MARKTDIAVSPDDNIYTHRRTAPTNTYCVLQDFNI